MHSLVITTLAAALFTANANAQTQAQAQAQLRTEEIPTKGGFYQEDQLKFRPKQLQNALESVRRIQAAMDETCSSVFISNSGYVLTNIHCLTRCNELAAKDPAKAGIKIIEANNSQATFSGMEITNQKKFVTFCNAHREERAVPYFVEPDLIGNLNLIWVGRGRINMHEEKLANPALSANDLTEMHNAMNDYAILKAMPKAESKLACLKPSELPLKDTPVWVIGFPAWNKRENGLGASGADKLISFGSAKESVKDDWYLKSLSTAMTSSERDLYWTRVQAFYDRTDWLRTDADAYGNNSGGAIVDENGDFSALLFSTTKVSFDSYTGATVFGISAKTIQSEVAESLGADIANRIFDCRTLP